MRIAVTGAFGGIGRSLVKALRDAHDVVGVVRTLRSDAGDPGVTYVASANAAEAYADADCVIHCALDAKSGLTRFLRVNRELNSLTLADALKGRCSIYVFLSSWVVYSCTEPEPGGYAESQKIAINRRSDPYTRLKIESEQEVMKACEDAGVSWIILRPTIVMGPGMLWSDRFADTVRLGLPAIRDRLVNAVHVDDLSLLTSRLIDRGVRNEILNIGGTDLESEQYFEVLGRHAQRRPRYLPAPVMRAARPLVPSTFWFLNDRRTVDLMKLERLAGPVPMRQPDEMFGRWTGIRRPRTLDELKALACSPTNYKAHGNNYSSWFMPSDPHGRVSLANYRGIVSFEPGRITVRAGTPLETICDYLDARGEALATLPEFLGISAGACFCVDVHGSSSTCFSLYETIDEIKYLDGSGDEVVSKRDEALWAELRRRRNRFIVTEVTFRTVPATLLSNRITWGGDKELDAYLAGGWRDNYATTIQWFPKRGRFLVYNINIATEDEARTARPAFTPFRGIPYNTQRALLAVQRGVQVDRWHRILGPWRRLIYAPVVFGGWTNRGRQFWIDVEMLFAIDDGVAMVNRLREAINAGDIPYARSTGIGMRFTHDPRTKRDYVWIEFFGKTEGIAKIVQLAEATAKRGVYFHGGKTHPPVTAERLADDPMLV